MTGEAKLRQYSREQFLKLHPWCCYCGAKATTTEHSPPRVIFDNRHWPAGHEYPSCTACNAAGREHEQVASVLLRISMNADETSNSDGIWRKNVQSLKRYRPDIVAELLSASANQTRRLLRQNFGRTRGDELRATGHRAALLGPKCNLALDAVMLRLAQTLFYKHVGLRCTGRAFTNRIRPENFADSDAEVQEFMPHIAKPMRASKDLSDQFSYRYFSSDEGAFFGEVKIRDQFAAMVIALDEPYATEWANIPRESKSMKQHSFASPYVAATGH